MVARCRIPNTLTIHLTQLTALTMAAIRIIQRTAVIMADIHIIQPTMDGIRGHGTLGPARTGIPRPQRIHIRRQIPIGYRMPDGVDPTVDTALRRTTLSAS